MKKLVCANERCDCRNWMHSVFDLGETLRKQIVCSPRTLFTNAEN
jgi:hypothetical protein